MGKSQELYCCLCCYLGGYDDLASLDGGEEVFDDDELFEEDLEKIHLVLTGKIAGQLQDWVKNVLDGSGSCN